MGYPLVILNLNDFFVKVGISNQLLIVSQFLADSIQRSGSTARARALKPEPGTSANTSKIERCTKIEHCLLNEKLQNIIKQQLRTLYLEPQPEQHIFNPRPSPPRLPKGLKNILKSFRISSRTDFASVEKTLLKYPTIC